MTARRFPLSRVPSALMRHCLPALLLVALSLAAQAQQETTPKRGFQPGGSYAFGEIETVSTSSGNLILRVPLVSLPKGRGEAVGQIGLYYNSKTWDVRPEVMSTGYYNATYNPIPRTYTRQRLVLSPEGRWRYGLKYELQLHDRMDYYVNAQSAPSWALPGCGNTGDNGAFRWKLKLAMPDGSVREFRPGGFTEGLQVYTTNYGVEGWYRVRPDGWETACVGGAHQNMLGGGWGTAGPMTYYAVDGSFLRLVIEHDGDDNNGQNINNSLWRNNRWTLHFPDGSRVVNESNGEQFIHDRNGHWVKIVNTVDVNNVQTVTLSDPFSRSVSLTYGDYYGGTPDLIRMRGFGNEEAVYKVRWTGVTISQNYSTEPNPLIASGTTHVPQPYENGIIPMSGGWLAVGEIELPTQAGSQKYLFTYDNTSWGQLASATLPTGARADYQYRLYGYSTTPPVYGGTTDTGYRRVTWDAPKQKTLTWNAEYDGQTPQAVTETWAYAPADPITDLPITGITAPDGGLSGESFTFLDKNPSYVTRPDGTVIERVWQANTPVGSRNYTNLKTNPYVATEFTSIKDAAGNLSKTAIKEFKYDKNGNLTQAVEYDWVAYSGPYVNAYDGTPLTSLPSGLTPKRVTVSEYHVPTPDATNSTTDDPNVYHKPTAPPLLKAVKSSEVRSGLSDATAVSRAEFDYDSATTTGNVTAQRSWDSTKGVLSRPLSTGNSISVGNTYAAWGGGATGKLTQTTDGNGNVTKFFYDNIGNGTTDLYVTKVIAADNAPAIRRTSESKYDFWTGLATESEDADNNVTTRTTCDVFGRPTLVENLDGTTVIRKATTEYSDTLRRVITRADKDTLGDGKLVSVQHYDQLGRTRLARTLESGVAADAYDETKGVKVQTRYLYSGSNGYSLVSNPYRAATSGAEATSEMGWARTKLDQGGRVLEAENFTGAAPPAPWGANVTSAGKVTTAYDAERVTITDQAGKQRRSVTDALGRLAQVIEDPNGLNYLTSYGYDALANLTSVTQDSQTRTFAYSSLSRLTSATNPESGTMTYGYDANGNLLTKTDARSITTNYQYDALGRNTLVTYSSYPHYTAAVERKYDGAVRGKGRFWYDVAYVYGSPATALKGPGGESYSHNLVNGYDALGRLLSRTQHFLVYENNAFVYKPYTVSRTYNLAGAVTSQTYPSGRVVNYSYDAAGRLQGFTGNLGNPGWGTVSYADSVQYNAAGQLTRERFGTQLELWHHSRYNSRLQLIDTRVGRSSYEWSWNRGALQFRYHGDQFEGPTNNGNPFRVDHWVPKDDTEANWETSYQRFYYDGANRLYHANEVSNTSSRGDLLEWKQHFDYDRFGNRTINAGGTESYFTNGQGQREARQDIVNELQYSVRTAKNQLMHAGDSVSDPLHASNRLRYDAVGNLVFDNYTQGAQWRGFDADNRLQTIRDCEACTERVRYSYDADGKRVKRLILAGATWAETWQVYGLDGELVAEYDKNANPASPQKEYGYRSGQLLVTADSTTIKWAVADHLGTPRMIIDKSGELLDNPNTSAVNEGVERHDYLPFGEELFAGTGIRNTTTTGYTGNSIRQKFTGYERDYETGLDFAQARYYSNIQGRFTSVDPENAGSDPDDPHSWNGYAYARSNPILFTDPDGREFIVCNALTGACGRVSDEDFYKDRDQLIAGGNIVVTSSGFLQEGGIYTRDGTGDANGAVAFYQQISIDDQAANFSVEMRVAINDPNRILSAAANALLGAIISGGRQGKGSKGWRSWTRTNTAAGRLPKFSGKPRHYVENKLREGGFTQSANDPDTWVHADGSVVRIDPPHRPGGPYLSQNKEHYHKSWVDKYGNELKLDDKGRVNSSPDRTHIIGR
jgi:RHS repeat-associated protein